MKSREKLLFYGSQAVEGLKDLPATRGFDGSVHLVILAAAQECVDPDGQAHCRMQTRAPAWRAGESFNNNSLRRKKAFIHKGNHLAINCGSQFLVL